MKSPDGCKFLNYILCHNKIGLLIQKKNFTLSSIFFYISVVKVVFKIRFYLVFFSILSFKTLCHFVWDVLLEK